MPRSPHWSLPLDVEGHQKGLKKDSTQLSEPPNLLKDRGGRTHLQVVVVVYIQGWEGVAQKACRYSHQRNMGTCLASLIPSCTHKRFSFCARLRKLWVHATKSTLESATWRRRSPKGVEEGQHTAVRATKPSQRQRGQNSSPGGSRGVHPLVEAGQGLGRAAGQTKQGSKAPWRENCARVA